MPTQTRKTLGNQDSLYEMDELRVQSPKMARVDKYCYMGKLTFCMQSSSYVWNSKVEQASVEPWISAL